MSYEARCILAAIKTLLANKQCGRTTMLRLAWMIARGEHFV